MPCWHRSTVKPCRLGHHHTAASSPFGDRARGMTMPGPAAVTRLGSAPGAGTNQRPMLKSAGRSWATTFGFAARYTGDAKRMEPTRPVTFGTAADVASVGRLVGSSQGASVGLGVGVGPCERRSAGLGLAVLVATATLLGPAVEAGAAGSGL